MLYLGVDLHKSSGWVTVLEADGQVRDSRKLSRERATRLGYFGKVEKPAAVAVEATFNWYYFLDLIEPLGFELHLVHPYKTRAIASARIKHDKLDSKILADLLRTNGSAPAWIAPRPIRAQRQLRRYRARSVPWGTRAKNAMHAIVNRQGIRPPWSRCSGRRGELFWAR